MDKSQSHAKSKKKDTRDTVLRDGQERDMRSLGGDRNVCLDVVVISLVHTAIKTHQIEYLNRFT